MARAPVGLQGMVVTGLSGAAVDDGDVCLTRGDEFMASTSINSDGTFALHVEVPHGVYRWTVLSGTLSAFRERVDVTGAGVEVGPRTVVLATSELAAGIHGQVWDSESIHPVYDGTISLVRDGRLLAKQSLRDDGWFSFRMTCHRPLPPGRYQLMPEVPGYTTTPALVTVGEAVPVLQVGRIAVRPMDSPRGDDERATT